MGNQCPYRHIAVTDVEREGGSVIPCKKMSLNDYILVGLIESTVRPIEDTEWVPVNTQTQQSTNQSKEQDIDIYESTLLPLKVDLPPSLIPIHSSIFSSIPPTEWG